MHNPKLGKTATQRMWSKSVADLQLIRLFLAIAVSNLVPQAEGTANDHAAEHAIFCNLIKLKDAKLVGEDTGPDTDEAIRDLRMLNFSTSSDEWQSLFDANADSVTPKQPPSDKLTTAAKAEWEAQWPHWWADARNQHTDNRGEGKTQKYQKIENTFNRAVAHIKIAALTAEGQAISSESQQLKDFVNNDATNKIKSYLKAAALGVGETTDKATAEHSFTGNNNWGTTCAKGALGKSIANDFMCVCHGTDGTTKICSENLAGKQWSAGLSLPADYEALYRSCKKTAPQALTEDQVEAAITAFYSALKKGDNANTKILHLGTRSSNCGGGEADLCVDYTEFVDKSGGSLKTIAWETQLRAAAGALRERTTKAALAKALSLQLHYKLAAAQAIYNAAKTANLAIMHVAPQQIPEKTATATKASCNQHNTNTTCTGKNCKWEGKSDTDGKCIVDETKATTQTNTGGTGEGAAGITKEGKNWSETTKCEGDKSCK